MTALPTARYGKEFDPNSPNYGKPFCEAAYLPDEANTVRTASFAGPIKPP